MLQGGLVSATFFHFPEHPFVLNLDPNPGSELSDRSTINALYGSDEFRMYSFKIKRCTKTRSHDWIECPFSHRGEKARRRDPRRHNYFAIACPNFRNGDCPKGEACEFAHGVFEYWLHPARYRTRACNAGLFCQRKVCFFAHTPSQLRSETRNSIGYIYRISDVGSEGDRLGEEEDGGELVVLGRATSAPLMGESDDDDPDEVEVGSQFLKSLRRLKIGPSDKELEKSAGSEILDLDLPHVGWISELVGK